MNEQNDLDTSAGSASRSSNEEEWELRRKALLHEIKKELEGWVKGRLNTALIGLTVAGIVGIQAIGYVVIHQTLGSKLETATTAVALMDDARKRAEMDVKQVVDKAKDTSLAIEAQSNEVRKQIAKLSEDAISIEQQLTSLAAKALAESENVRSQSQLALSGVNARLDKLTADLSIVLAKGKATDKLIAAQKDLSEDIEVTKKRFSINSNFSVAVYARNDDDKEVKRVIESLRNDGFKTGLRPVFYSTGTGQEFFDGFKGKIIMYRHDGEAKLRDVQKTLGKQYGVATEVDFTDHPTASGYAPLSDNFLVFIP